MLKKELRVLVVAPLGVGGVTNMMINIQKKLLKDKIFFDYLVYHNRTEPKENVVFNMGSKKYIASADHIRFKSLRIFFRLFAFRRACRESECRIMHYNIDNALCVPYMIAARLGGIKYITLHSHIAGVIEKNLLLTILHYILKPFIPIFANEFWACSEKAAIFMYPKSIVERKKYKIVPNGIDLEQFTYCPEKEHEIRKEINIENKFVIGHAGRFTDQKNHFFLIDIFEKVHDIDSNTFLLLAGNGELFSLVKAYVKEKGLQKYVYFLGDTDKMDYVWQLVDVFVMPSKVEGLPVSGIEAQAVGVQCVFSTEISREVDVSQKSLFLNLSLPAEKWAEAILNFRKVKKADNVQLIIDAGYDIKKTSEQFKNTVISGMETIYDKNRE